MKITLKHIFAYIVIVILTIFTSCQDEEFDFTKEDVRAGAYNRNFDNYYGKVQPDQIWDFSTYNLNRLGLEGGPSAALTRSGENPSRTSITRAVQEDGSIVEYTEIKKRYMIEDRGSIVDWDFNDIVVDVVRTIKKNEVGSVLDIETIASVVCLRGTIPFRLSFGGTVFGNGIYANDVDATIPSSLVNQVVNNWDPENNNISVEVWPDLAGATQEEISKVSNGNTLSGIFKGTSSQKFDFPNVGDHPYIIATDVNVNPMGEGINIDENWLVTKPVYYNVSVSANDENMGTVSISPDPNDITFGQYQATTNITLTATAADGYVFDYWANNNVSVSSDAIYNFKLTEDKQGDYIAHFKQVAPIVEDLGILLESSYASIYNGRITGNLDRDKYQSSAGNLKAHLVIYYQTSRTDYYTPSNIASEGSTTTLTAIVTQSGNNSLWNGSQVVTLGNDGYVASNSFRMNELWQNGNSAIVLVYSGNNPGTITITKVELVFD